MYGYQWVNWEKFTENPETGEIEKIRITIHNPIFNILWIENFIKFSEFI